MAVGGQEEPAARAYELALRALSRKERTVREMRELLEARELEPGLVDSTLERLADVGALDDRDYARRFVDDRRSLAGWGRQRIAADLARRGVETEIVEAALVDEGTEQELERAESLLSERGLPLSDDRERNRALGFLARRGFELETAYAAIRRQTA